MMRALVCSVAADAVQAVRTRTHRYLTPLDIYCIVCMSKKIIEIDRLQNILYADSVKERASSQKENNYMPRPFRFGLSKLCSPRVLSGSVLPQGRELGYSTLLIPDRTTVGFLPHSSISRCGLGNYLAPGWQLCIL